MEDAPGDLDTRVNGVPGVIHFSWGKVFYARNYEVQTTTDLTGATGRTSQPEMPGLLRLEIPGLVTNARFSSGAGAQYGWVRIQWAGCPDDDFIVKDYAWGDPGDQIKTGQKQLREGEAVVAPPAAKGADAAPLADAKGSLGLLALGAVGLQAWRKSRRG